jgi:hypothetical protein
MMIHYIVGLKCLILLFLYLVWRCFRKDDGDWAAFFLICTALTLLTLSILLVKGYSNDDQLQRACAVLHD